LTAEVRKPATNDAVQAWTDALAGGAPWAEREPAATRLAQWLDWTDSIALAAAVDRAQTGAATRSQSGLPRAEAVSGARLVEQGQARLRAALKATVQEAVAEWSLGGPKGRDPADLRRGVARAQRQMDDGVARLRAALREQLSSTGPEGRELAAIDAVLEQALAERQRHLLSGAAGRLARLGENARFGSKSPEAAGEPGATGTAPRSAKATGQRLVTSRLVEELMAPLTAELELRLQPLRGLEQALHPTEPQ
jgi:hypothetical protein